MTDYNNKLHGNSRPFAYENARNLRKTQTDAEKKLWQIVRNEKVCGLKFRRQHAFDDYILDFYCHKIKLAIEVDGAIHNNPEIAAYDAVRTKNLNASGITVLRFTNDEVMKNSRQVIKKIEEWLHANSPDHSSIK